MKVTLGFALAFLIGAACRLAALPLPAPPVLIGALLVVAMTVGYVLTDRVASYREARHRALCAGPSGAGAGESR
jgi:XapX domain-containing protein